MQRSIYSCLMGLGGSLGFALMVASGCTSLAKSGLPLALGGSNAPQAPEASGSAAVAMPVQTREILPFKTGQHFEYAVRYHSALPVGTLKLDVQSDTVSATGETIGLAITDPLGKSNVYPLEVADAEISFDSKPYLPTSMHSGEFWSAQDGLVQVEARESVDVPFGHFPYCYRVLYTNSQGEGIRLWLSPNYGLVKGVFNLQIYSQGEIDLTSGPATGSISGTWFAPYRPPWGENEEASSPLEAFQR